MKGRISVFLAVVVLLPVCNAQLFLPKSCQEVCKGVAFKNVKNSSEAFLEIDSGGGNREFVVSRASSFAVVLLKLVSAGFPAQSTLNTTLVASLSRSAVWAPQVREAVAATASNNAALPPAQVISITPPAVARLLGAYSLAVYQAFAVWSEYLYAYGACWATGREETGAWRCPARLGRIAAAAAAKCCLVPAAGKLQTQRPFLHHGLWM